jgi:flagellar assembly protein FliH
MPWSRSVLKKKEAETQVLEYNPITFQLGTPQEALNYLEAKKLGADFRLSDVVRHQTGIEEIEQQNDEQRVEDRALEKLKEIQESAYLEGKKLGLDEGRKQAFEAHGKEISERLAEMQKLTYELSNMKKEILNFNEAHIIQLLFHFSSKLAQTHLEYDSEPLLNTIKSALELAHGEEKITIHVSEKQIQFLEKLKSENKVEFDYLDKVKLTSNSNISPGGCIVETNYGEVDAQIEQRINQLWAHLKEHMPKVKDKILSSK